MAVPVKIDPSKPEETKDFSTPVPQKKEQSGVSNNTQGKHLSLLKRYKNVGNEFARPTASIGYAILRFALRIARSQRILNLAARTFAQQFPSIGNRLRLFARMNPPPKHAPKRSIFSFIIKFIQVKPILKNMARRLLQKYPKIFSRLHLLKYTKSVNVALQQITIPHQEGLSENQKMSEPIGFNPQQLALRQALQRAVANWNLGQQRD